MGTEKAFRKIVRFAKKNKIVVINDATYASIVFDGAKPCLLYTSIRAEYLKKANIQTKMPKDI